MIASASSRPDPGYLAYYRCSWLGGPAEGPFAFWYEVNHDGAVLRLVAVYPDGAMTRDAISNYPDHVTEFGVGTLAQGDFFAYPWSWPEPHSRDATVMLDAEPVEFDAVWARARP